MDIYVFVVLGLIIGYIIGSIPFALVIGKGIYHIDVRNYGSGNLGSTNVARILGPLPGAMCLILDMLKGGLTSFIMYKIAYSVLSNSTDVTYQLQYAPIVFFITAFAVCIGHSHPLFSNFKGGKCVASVFGIMLFFNWKLALVGVVIFISVLIITRIVSLSSILSVFGVMISLSINWVKQPYLFTIDNKLTEFIYIMTFVFLAILIIYRHLSNIQKIIKGEEKKFSFGHHSKIEKKD